MNHNIYLTESECFIWKDFICSQDVCFSSICSLHSQKCSMPISIFPMDTPLIPSRFFRFGSCWVLLGFPYTFVTNFFSLLKTESFPAHHQIPDTPYPMSGLSPHESANLFPEIGAPDFDTGHNVPPLFSWIQTAAFSVEAFPSRAYSYLLFSVCRRRFDFYRISALRSALPETSALKKYGWPIY